MTDRPRYPVGTRLRFRLSGSVWTIEKDWHPHPNVVKTARITDDRYYVVEVNGHRDVMHHEVIADGCDVIPDDPPAEDGTP
ncbi:hypothetical protein AB0J55_17680 [Amycolatopsis sp. NPDC049688]|uniref:hypothetical protein n=1 Tax=Amycolatopsis sp. NPDC049688 TaxID=3154733 RepID=UPI00341FEC32